MAKRGRPRKALDEVAAEITRQMEEQWKLNAEKFVSVSKEMAEEVCEELRTSRKQVTGEYAKGWTVTEDIRRDGYGGKFVAYIVHNKDSYRLTHLLNNGHATVTGGWVNGDEHITKAYVKIPERLAKKIKENL